MSGNITVLRDESQATVRDTEAPSYSLPKIIAASACGTLIEWYDFFVFGSLASTLASKFYKTGTPDGDLIAWLAAFAVGFIVRPFGAIVFGYIGDKVGRKFTFTLTLVVMGLCTALVGCLPTIQDIGVTAGYLLIILRIVQGLAIGGEYGGAATYIAEYSPAKHRGFYTSFIQVTATAGLFLSLAVILICKVPMGDALFNNWGWRLPFLLSIVLVGVSLYIRMALDESPMFNRMKTSGKIAKNPLVESFCRTKNLYYVGLALFGATAGQGVVWYTCQFYSLTFLTTYAKVPVNDTYIIIGTALLLASPFFILVGYLSDTYGRKPFMLAGLVLPLATWYPIFQAFMKYGYTQGNYQPVLLSFLVFVQVIFVALVYGPIAAFLVELFPTSIRYTSMSLPYHIGNGVFGGLVPVIGVSVTKASGNTFGGLWFPLGVAGFTLICMIFFTPETYQNDLETEVEKDEYEKVQV